MALTGYIHQLESFGCADGPGSRFIIFFSGCPFRCLYCHNPDTWEMTKGKLYTADELLAEAEDCRDFWVFMPRMERWDFSSAGVTP